MSAPTLARPELARVRPGPRSTTQPEATSRRPRRLAACGLAVVLVAFAARGVDVARSMSITGDEATHLTHCLHFWMTGDDLDMWELGAPRLPHVLYALPSYLVLKQAGMLPAEPDRLAIEKVVLSGARRVLWPARGVAIAWGMALIAVVFWTVGRDRGPWAGLIAAALLALVPEVAAHSAIAGSDVPYTAAAFLAIALMARYVERPGAGRWVGVGLGIGLAWAMRHSALLLLIQAGLVHAWVALRRPREPGVGPVVERLIGSGMASLGMATVAALVLWAGDGFQTITVAELADRAATVQIPDRVGPLDISGCPLPSSALSVLKQVRHQNKGHEAFFCGEVREQGWPQYFPVAFLLKTPLGLLLLMILAAARTRPRGAWDAVCLMALAVLWLMLVRNKVNIGVRYAMLTYPLALPFIARLFEPKALRDRVWGPVSLAALAWFVATAVACHPRPLSTFNEIVGGPADGWIYLADSNVDWGQDFDAVLPELRRLGIDEVTTDISSERRLEAPGLLAVANPSRAMVVPAVTPLNRRLYDAEGGYLPVYTRYVAISASRLHGLYSQNNMGWLRTRRLVSRIGDSVFLFDMDRPADRPLAP